MYHDQGLPVLKHASFGEGVNITLGLPIIRTSVDHGTALDLAGSGRIDAGQPGGGDRCGHRDGRHRTVPHDHGSCIKPRRRSASTSWSTAITSAHRRGHPTPGRVSAWWRSAPGPAP
jgi:hypothetical protein